MIGIHCKQIFTLQQAQELLPLVYRLSEQAADQVANQMNRLKAYPDSKHPKAIEIEITIQKIIAVWQSKLERLGLAPKGLWMADFDKGDGYFCWKFPETEIKYSHGYQDGFSGRILIK